MRKCEITYFDRSNDKMVTTKGYFHQWGQTAVSNDKGMVLRTVAIVEKYDTHEIIMEVPNKLSFVEGNEFEVYESEPKKAVRAKEIQIPDFVHSGRRG